MQRFIFLMMQCCVVMSVSCPSDMNQDHRPRVSCVAQSLTDVPDGIKPDTQVLVLKGNHFSSLSWSSYSGFTQLHELDLSHNHITTLEPPGPVLENLSVLRLSGNRLTGLGGQVFRSTPNLMEIYLDSNQIRSLHDTTFSDLPGLEVINLSQNKLPALPPRLLERVSSSKMKTFDLENNSISLMPNGFFSSKHELPYVYLCHNPWLCSCDVGYLHFYLNDQEHNVYKHEEPNSVVPGSDCVVCSGPPHLFQRPIIELEENDFCPPDPPLYPSGDRDFKPISIKPNSNPQTQNAPHDTTTITHLPTYTKSWTGFWVTPESWTETWFEYWTIWEYFILTPTMVPETFTTQSITSQPTTSELPTTGSSTARSQHPRTAQLDPHPSRTMITVQTKPPTTGPNTARSQRASTAQLDPHPSRTMITVQTKPPTIGPITTRPEPYTSRTTVRVRTEWIIPQTSVAPHWADARDAGGRMLPWCLWLFAGFVLLCVLSALTSCFLFLWLLRIYLVIYRQLKHHGMARSGNEGVILRAYRTTENSQGREIEGESVSFLTLEQLKDARAVFRSVLFINQREEQHGVRESMGRDVSPKIELVSVADEARDKEQEPMMSGEVFRKTLYRVISREEEADGWREGTTARYRLILREERGRQPETQWVVGEWEMGDEGVAYQRSCSLIGQPSTVALE